MQALPQRVPAGAGRPRPLPQSRSQGRHISTRWPTAIACAFHVDPIEKKPLFHFLPGTSAFSFAATGCGFRCLNCQNWDLSQRKPEEMKDPRGESLRIDARNMAQPQTASDMERRSLFPEDVVALTQYFECPSIAYTYSEPTVVVRVHARHGQGGPGGEDSKMSSSPAATSSRSRWSSCAGSLDAVHVDLKGFSDEMYAKLNSGKLAPILATIEDPAATGGLVRGDQPRRAHLHRPAGDDPPHVPLAGGQRRGPTARCTFPAFSRRTS